MAEDVHLTYASALILSSVRAGIRYGFEIMDMTGLPSGTVYPALRRMEQAGLVRSRWESDHDAVAQQRPARKYYALTREGQQALSSAQRRYRPLEQMVARDLE